MGSHSAAGEFAAVELMLEEGQYQKALTTVQEVNLAIHAAEAVSKYTKCCLKWIKQVLFEERC